jgi:hypothetical protein
MSGEISSTLAVSPKSRWGQLSPSSDTAGETKTNASGALLTVTFGRESSKIAAQAARCAPADQP